MPIVRIAGKLVYFAHVPKCAGSVVEDYLSRRFGTVGFLDRRHLLHDASDRWSRSSPQHIPVTHLQRLLPADLFDARFALVRHPVSRIVSVFRHQRDVAQELPPDTVFGDWLRELPARLGADPFHLDNHARPMTEIVPGDATVFRLEQGTAPLIAWLDALAGDSDGPREITARKDHAFHMDRLKRAPGRPVTLTEADRAQVAALYAADFDRFGYDPEDGAAIGAAAGEAT